MTLICDTCGLLSASQYVTCFLQFVTYCNLSHLWRCDILTGLLYKRRCKCCHLHPQERAHVPPMRYMRTRTETSCRCPAGHTERCAKVPWVLSHMTSCAKVQSIYTEIQTPLQILRALQGLANIKYLPIHLASSSQNPILITLTNTRGSCCMCEVQITQKGVIKRRNINNDEQMDNGAPGD